MKIGLVQMRSESHLERNIGKMRAYLTEAKEAGADRVVFPETAYFTGAPAACQEVVSSYDELCATFGGWAKQLDVEWCPGSVREPVSLGSKRFYNTLLWFGRDGDLRGKYRKIHLFRASLPDRNYDETRDCDPGDELLVLESAGFRVGVAICFDLRFPELFRALKASGSELVVLPAAFTETTGRDHWLALLRARAIENQFFMVAVGQVGVAGDGGAKQGQSLVISPWGEVLLDMGAREGAAVFEIDRTLLRAAQARVDAWACRREELF